MLWGGLALQACSVVVFKCVLRLESLGDPRGNALRSHRSLALWWALISWTLDTQPTCYMRLASSKQKQKMVHGDDMHATSGFQSNDLCNVDASHICAHGFSLSPHPSYIS